jgi:transcriptional regulator with XRE-family HTH domain
MIGFRYTQQFIGDKMINEAEIGKRIREFRLKKNFTLQMLADKTGYSKGYLSKVEKSDKAPPVTTLSTIARELDATVAGFLGEGAQKDNLCVVRKNKRTLMAGNDAEFGYAYEALANPYPNKHMEPFILSYHSKDALKYSFQHEGEEMLFVLQGKIRFKYGDREFVLEEGDCVYFDSSILHTGEPIGDEKLKCLIVIYTSTPRGPVDYEHIRQRIVST